MHRVGQRQRVRPHHGVKSRSTDCPRRCTRTRRATSSRASSSKWMTRSRWSTFSPSRTARGRAARWREPAVSRWSSAASAPSAVSRATSRTSRSASYSTRWTARHSWLSAADRRSRSGAAAGRHGGRSASSWGGMSSRPARRRCARLAAEVGDATCTTYSTARGRPRASRGAGARGDRPRDVEEGPPEAQVRQPSQSGASNKPPPWPTVSRGGTTSIVARKTRTATDALLPRVLSVLERLGPRKRSPHQCQARGGGQAPQVRRHLRGNGVSLLSFRARDDGRPRGLYRDGVLPPSSPSNCGTRAYRRTFSWASSRRTSRLRSAGARSPK